MNTLLKRFLFVMIAATLLRAGPAMSVPLAASSSDDALASQQGTTDPDGQYSPFRRVGGTDGNDAEVGIVSSEALAYGPQADKAEMASHPSYGASGHAAMNSSGVARSGKSPGWIKPVAAVGAGSSLYALFSGSKHGKGGNDKGGLGDGGSGTGGGGGGNGGGGLGDDSPGPGDDLPGDIPSEVPEPGTMLLMGIGIAGYLGRRKIMKK